MNNVPFYKNPGSSCGQTAMKCALGVVMPERKFSYSELEGLTGHIGNEVTMPIQIAFALQELNVDFSYFAKLNWINLFLDKEKFDASARKAYGNDSSKILKLTDYSFARCCAQRLAESPNVVERDSRPSIEELRKLVVKGVPICLINYDRFAGRENHFAGHYLILTEVGRNSITYHNTGPIGACPNKKAPIKRFSDAWNLCPYDWDLIVVNSQ